MLQTRKQTWITVDIGSRWIKCVHYVKKQGEVEAVGSKIIDIQNEGLLSAEEIGEAVRKALGPLASEPIALVLPDESAVSQVMDLPEFSADAPKSQIDDELLDLIGLSRSRCVYDSCSLEAFGGYSNPQWITVAKEEELSRKITPLLSHGLRIEAATTTGNALVAAFQYTHPEVADAYLVDLGATQSTIIRILGGQPVQLASFAEGGEKWAESLLDPRKEAFEETEARLFRSDLFGAPEEGAALRGSVEAWRSRVMDQIGEWSGDSGLPVENSAGDVHIYLYGGYSAMNGLLGALNAPAQGVWRSPDIASAQKEDERLVWAPAYGAALMAMGISRHEASILPHSLVKMRQRRRRALHLRKFTICFFILLTFFIIGATFKQSARLGSLTKANQEARATLSQIEASAALLEQRNALAERIEPIVSGQLNSIYTLETFAKLLQVRRDFDFTMIRFADRLTYFREMGAQARADALGGDTREPTMEASQNPPRAYVVELVIRGSQAERLNALGKIVGSLRKDNYFSNVDRLVGLQFGVNSSTEMVEQDEVYALLLTLADKPLNLGKKGLKDD